MVRLVLFDRLGRVLLAQHHDAAPADPSAPDALTYWVLPGGGQEPGEGIVDVRWWRLQAVADAHETFFPAGLVDLLRALVDGEAPKAPPVLP